MDSGGLTHLYLMRALYLALCAFIFFLSILPVSMIPTWIILPDFVLAISLALIVRRAQYLPFILVAFALCIQDFLMSQPLGLGMFIGLILSEIIRSRQKGLRQATFGFEWLSVGCLILAGQITGQLMLNLTYGEFGTFYGLLGRGAMTVAFYPIACLIVGVLFGAWKATEPRPKILGAA